MWEQEKKHLDVMNKLQLQHRVRPTILTEVAKVGGYGLGLVTAILGKEAAMACTEAVETVIGEHYDECVFVPHISFDSSVQYLFLAKPIEGAECVEDDAPKYTSSEGCHNRVPG